MAHYGCFLANLSIINMGIQWDLSIRDTLGP